MSADEVPRGRETWHAGRVRSSSQRCGLGALGVEDEPAVLCAQIQAVIDTEFIDQLLQLAQRRVGIGVNVEREISAAAAELLENLAQFFRLLVRTQAFTLLSKKSVPSTFILLYDACMNVLDVQSLNDEFFMEFAAWYYCGLLEVTFGYFP